MGSAARIAFIQAQTVCALARIEGMKAQNAMRARRGESPAFTLEQFDAVPVEFGISWNQVIDYLRDA